MTVAANSQIFRRRGSVMAYSVVMIFVLMGIISLGVDFGRVALVKTQLREMNDAAAMYAARMLPTLASVQAYAQIVANENSIDGTTHTYQSSDVEVGYWNTSTRTFTANGTPINAVRVYGKRLKTRNTAVSLLFGKIIGYGTQDVNVTSIALWNSGTTQTVSVSGKNSVSYYGLPIGTNIPDPWGGDTIDSSMLPTEVAVTPGQTLNMSVTGTVTYQTWSGDSNAPEGYSWSAYMQQPQYVNSNGFSDINAPGMSLVAAFVGTSSSVPAALDFSTTATRDVNRVLPAVKQQFYVGNGKQSTGANRSYIVPAGATKIVFGTADSWVWRDNGGTLSVTITTSGYPTLVK